MLILRKLAILKLVSLLLLMPVDAVANSREDAIKSGFIFNFARYSHGDWFNSAEQQNYNICAFNSDFISAATNALKGVKIEKRPVKLHLLMPDNLDISHCNTLFFSKNDHDFWNNLSDKSALSKLMLVGEFDGFLSSGGQINFFLVGGKVRFEINLVKLKLSGIKMSSKVLRLGRIHKGSH